MGVIFLRNKVAAAGGGAFDPSTISGMVAAWDMETVYQDASLTTAAGDGDPIGGVPDLSGNGNILSQSGSSRPPRRSAGGLFYADLDGEDDYFNVTFPTGQRTSDMTLILGVEMGASEADFGVFSSGTSNNPYVGLGIDGGGFGTDAESGTPSYHIDDGSAITPKTRDVLRDTLVAAGTCVFEVRNFNTTTSFWVSFGNQTHLWALRGTLFRSNNKTYRAVLVDNLTISSEDLAAAREWVAEGAGVTL